jgi:hypothetical protein
MLNPKLILLKSNESIVAQIEELEVELGLPDCKLINPFSVGTDYIYEGEERWIADLPADDIIGKPCQKRVALERWPWYTDQREIVFNSDNILTILSPNAELLKAYIDVIPPEQLQETEETDEVLQEY